MDDVDRLEKLLDVALAAFRAGDDDSTLMALKEASKTADKLPKKASPSDVIYLPDGSR